MSTKRAPPRSASSWVTALKASMSTAMRARSRPDAKGVSPQSGIDSTITCDACPPAKRVARARSARNCSRYSVDRSPAVLIVHADQQRDEIERAGGIRIVDAGGQLIRRPARARNDRRIGDAQTASTKQGRQSNGPALLVADGLADGVRITERENSNLCRWLSALNHGFT